MKITDFMILVADNTDDLGARVRAEIANGWQPWSQTIVFNWRDEAAWLGQPMVKFEQQDDQERLPPF